MAPLQTNAGKAIVTNRLLGAGTEPKFVAIGTGNTAESTSQTALVAEVETRASGTSSRTTTTATNDTYTVVGSVTATSGRAVVESGLFDAVSSGNMYTRAVFSVVNLSSGDSIQVTWNVAYT